MPITWRQWIRTGRAEASGNAPQLPSSLFAWRSIHSSLHAHTLSARQVEGKRKMIDRLLELRHTLDMGTISEFGKVWPQGTPHLDMHRWFYLNSPDADTRYWHMRAGISLLWPEQMNNTRGFVHNTFGDRAFRAWCRDQKRVQMTWIGAGGIGKSTIAAAALLWDWLCDPEDTATRVATNTKLCLRKRVWSEIERLFCLHPEGTFASVHADGAIVPCVYTPSTLEIRCGAKGYIQGISVEGGTEQQAMDSIKGAHSKRARVICDELDTMPMGTIDALDNARKACESFIFVGTGNPTKRVGNPLGIMSEPATEHWEDVTVDAESWPTKWGVCLFFDGRKSPGVLDPDKFGKFMLNQEQIDETARIHGIHSSLYWSQCIGFFPPESLRNAIIDEPLLIQFDAMSSANWVDSFQTGLALDPAISVKGDRCVVRPFGVGAINVFQSVDPDSGPVMKRRQAIVLFEPIHIKIELRPDRTATDAIAEDLRLIAEKWGVSPRHIAIDCTGNQGAIADYIEAKLGRGVYRIHYSGSAGQRPLDAVVNDRLRKNQRGFLNKRAEMYYAFRMYVRWGQIRGLDRNTASELTLTEWASQKPPFQVEDKEEVKKRIGQSPDDADAAVMAVDLARYRMDLAPAGESSEIDLREQERLCDYDREMYTNMFRESWKPSTLEV